LAQNIALTVKIGGKSYSPISYCSINERIDWHHTCEVLMPVDGFAKSNNTILDQVKDFIGQKIEISFKIKKPKESDIQNEFYGIVTKISLNRRNRGNKEILIQGYSPTILLDGQPNCRVFVNKTIEEIANILFERIPEKQITLECNPSFKGQIPYITQYKESNFKFLCRLTDSFGEWCFYDGKKVIVGKLKKEEKVNLPIDVSLSDFDFSLGIENINRTVCHYNYEENRLYEFNTNSLNINDLENYGNHALDTSERIFQQKNFTMASELFEAEKQFTFFNETKKYQKTKELIMADGVSDHPYINTGSIINITGESKNEEDFGEFIILSVNHSIDVTANYINHFTAIPAQANVPPMNKSIIHPLAEVQPAQVIDNADPEKLGRVKIKFFWQEKEEDTPWLRIAQVYGGQADNVHQHGFYFIPEIGDEVIVGFESDNPDKPFIIGNAYHKNSPPDHWYDDQNAIKSIRTRNGNQIVFIDKDGNEEIRILNKDDQSPTNEISLSLSDRGKILIKTEGDLEISADSIKISSNTDIVLESGKDTQVSANNYKLNSNNEVSIAGQKIEIEGSNSKLKGNAQLEIEGGQSSLKAQMLAVDGGAQTEIKGARVSVNGSAQVEVKGGIIMLN
jgi:type VI secretion system secreted protein VgrG